MRRVPYSLGEIERDINRAAQYGSEMRGYAAGRMPQHVTDMLVRHGYKVTTNEDGCITISWSAEAVQAERQELEKNHVSSND